MPKKNIIASVKAVLPRHATNVISMYVVVVSAPFGDLYIPSVLMSTALGLHPRAVLISTSGIFPVYLLKPWVNLYVCLDCVHTGDSDPSEWDSSIQ